MRELIDKLNSATKAYDEGNPIMTDKEWDDLYFQLVKLEEETGIIYPDSPTQNIQYDVVNKLNKVTHNHKMLSLQKTKDLDEVEAFFGDKKYVAMFKMDGLTCSLTYENGSLISAETRGNGEVGEDILHNAKIIPSIPQSIPYKDRLVVDGEIICSYDDFKEFQDTYKNPRNFAAGSIRLLSAKECSLRKLTFIAWEVIEGLETESNNSFPKKLLSLRDFGFITVPMIVGITKNDIIDLVVVILKRSAVKLGYPIDGIVFKFDDIEYGKSLGETNHHLKNAIAYKFYDDTYLTKLIDIEWSLGRTGVLTPIAVFDPIEIDGSNVSRASLHNVSIMEEILGMPYVGQVIKVIKANEIIPQVVSARKEPEEKEVKYIPIPAVCPVCGKATEIKCDVNSEMLVCANPSCEGKLINHLDHFCGKKGLDIKGLSKATLEKLIDWGWIKSVSDLYNLKNYEKEWVMKSGFGEKSVKKILDAIEESKTTELWRFISALGIPLIGSTYAKEMCKHEIDWFCIREDIFGGFDYSKWEGFGPEMNSALHEFNYDEADYLANNILSLVNSLYVKNSSNVCITTALTGKKIVITGKLNHFKNRDELKIFIERSGGKVVNSISKTTDMLINNDINSESSKNIAAKKLGIPIISEEDFILQYYWE